MLTLQVGNHQIVRMIESCTFREIQLNVGTMLLLNYFMLKNNFWCVVIAMYKDRSRLICEMYNNSICIDLSYIKKNDKVFAR